MTIPNTRSLDPGSYIHYIYYLYPTKNRQKNRDVMIHLHRSIFCYPFFTIFSQLQVCCCKQGSIFATKRGCTWTWTLCCSDLLGFYVEKIYPQLLARDLVFYILDPNTGGLSCNCPGVGVEIHLYILDLTACTHAKVYNGICQGPKKHENHSRPSVGSKRQKGLQ